MTNDTNNNKTNNKTELYFYEGPEYSIWTGTDNGQLGAIPIKIRSGDFKGTVFYFDDVHLQCADEEFGALGFSVVFIDLEYLEKKLTLQGGHYTSDDDDIKAVDLIGLDATERFYEENAKPILLDIITEISKHPEVLENHTTPPKNDRKVEKKER